MRYEKLFSLYKIGNLEIKNRVVMTAMCTGTADSGTYPGERFRKYYTERAKGGCGLMITEIARVNDKHGAVCPQQLSLTHDRFIEPLAKTIDAVHAEGAKIFVQLHHPGRQTLSSYISFASLLETLGRAMPATWKLANKIMPIAVKYTEHPAMMFVSNHFLRPVVAPSAVKSAYGLTICKDQPVRELQIKEIKELVRQFGQSARRAQKAGADGVEIHAGHGYLLSQFLSPHTNRRQDAYGGSLENRARIIKDIIDEIRGQCGKGYPISVRFNADDFFSEIGMPGVGIQLEEGVEMAKAFESMGADLLNVSGATYETLNANIETTYYPPGWRTYLAKAVKDVVKIPVLAVGVIRTPEQAEKLLQDGELDFVGLGRPTIADPHWARKAREGRSGEIIRCISCVNCFESAEAGVVCGEPAKCAMNPRSMHEHLYPETGGKDDGGRKVVVVGAGPAGLTAARELGMRGFQVTVLEKACAPGGQLVLASNPPYKDRFRWAIQDLETLAVKAGADIRYSTEATVERIDSLKPYAVILASGGEAVKPGIPGADLAFVSTVTPVLDQSMNLENKNVAVIGSGMTGLETADLLAAKGNKITVVEMADQIAPGAWMQHVWDVVSRLEKYGATWITSCRLTEIKPGAIVIENVKSGGKKTIEVDHVVLSVGVRSINHLAGALKGRYEKVYCVGDANMPGRLAKATREAFEIARRL